MNALPAPLWLSPQDPPHLFPPTHHALTEPDGLLAIGGSLSPERLAHAYRHGIFPWDFWQQQPLWWAPRLRFVLPGQALHLPRRLHRKLRHVSWLMTTDTCFQAVIAACAQPRSGQHGTWLTPQMQAAYLELHHQGLAHSIEIWDEGRLIGGLYGVHMGRVFSGESMFHRIPDASKAAVAATVALMGLQGILDCQVASPHMKALGGQLMERDMFEQVLLEPARPWGLPTPLSGLSGQSVALRDVLSCANIS